MATEYITVMPGDGVDSVFMGDGEDIVTVDFSAFDIRINGNIHHHYLHGPYLNYQSSGGDGVELYQTEHVRVIGGSAADYLNSDAGNDSISGGDGNDSLFAGEGMDTLDGGLGDDSLVAGSGGADVIFGGAGMDFLQLDRSDETVDASFNFGGPLAASFWDGTSVNGVERISVTTGSGDDFASFVPMTGYGTNVFNGLGGNDTIRVDFQTFSEVVTSYAHTDYTYGRYFTIWTPNSGYDGVVFYGENVNVIGGSANDVLHGAEGSDTLLGMGGDDTLFGREGMDSLSGGDGNDVISADEGGPDTVDGGAGIDQLTLDRSSATEAMDIVLGRSATAFALSDGTSVQNVERLDFQAGSGDDQFTLLIEPGNGMHTIIGHAGTDTLTVDYSGINGAARMYTGLDYSYGTYFNTDLGAGVDGARFFGENVGFVGALGNDRATAGAGNDTLSGLGGDDTLNADAGMDSVSGGDGNDHMTVGEGGPDTVDGGAGIDQLTLDRSSATAAMDFVLGRSDTAFTLSDGTSVQNVERLNFQAGSGDDHFTLLIEPGNGMHTIIGNGGTDTLTVDYSGITGAARIYTGLDYSYGTYFNTDLGAGVDGARFFGENVNFIGAEGNDQATAEAGNDTLSGNGGSDTLNGAAGMDLLSGGDGVDHLNGGTGDDTLSGGLGDDQINGGDGDDRAIVGANLSDTTVSGTATTMVLSNAQGSDSFTGVETFEFLDGVFALADVLSHIGLTQTGTPGNDTLDGSLGDDSLVGLDGDDLLRGDAGNDTLEAGDGVDTLIGGDGHDLLLGGETEADLRDVIYAGGGNDLLDGGYGNDELRGDAGMDTITGGFGVDDIFGGDGDDQLTGQAWSDLIFGGAGADFINGGFGYDRVNGGADADRFFHLGVADHGSDWIQDYTAADGDVLQFGQAGDISQFQVNFTETASAGTAGVEEAFVIYRPTGQILWALVDGQAQSEINLLMGGVTYDLLA